MNLNNVLGQANKYGDLAWKYLFDKGYWVYVAGGAGVIFVFIILK